MERTTAEGTREQTWAARIARAREKGLTPRAMAQELGVAQSTVYAWRRKIEGGTYATRSDKTAPSRLPPFARLEREQPIPMSAAPSSRGLVLEAAGVTIRLTDAADVDLAARLVRALERESR